MGKLKSGVVDAFENALEQVQFRNPKVTLNLEWVHVNAYVEDGVFVPAPVPLEASELGAEVNLEQSGGDP